MISILKVCAFIIIGFLALEGANHIESESPGPYIALAFTWIPLFFGYLRDAFYKRE